jgi:hypothetical protein
MGMDYRKSSLLVKEPNGAGLKLEGAGGEALRTSQGCQKVVLEFAVVLNPAKVTN